MFHVVVLAFPRPLHGVNAHTGCLELWDRCYVDMMAVGNVAEAEARDMSTLVTDMLKDVGAKHVLPSQVNAPPLQPQHMCAQACRWFGARGRASELRGLKEGTCAGT